MSLKPLFFNLPSSYDFNFLVEMSSRRAGWMDGRMDGGDEGGRNAPLNSFIFLNVTAAGRSFAQVFLQVALVPTPPDKDQLQMSHSTGSCCRRDTGGCR